MFRAHRPTSDRNDSTDEIDDYFIYSITLDSSSGYIDYLFRSLKGSNIYLTWKRLLKYFRRFRLLRTLYKILSLILVLLRTSALIILIALVLSVIIPLSALAFLAFPLISWIRSFRINKTIIPLVTGKDVFVILPPRSDAFARSEYLFRNASDIATRRDGLSIIVSPYFFSPATPMGYAKKHYTNLIMNGSNVIVVRRYYYFSIKKKILSEHANSLSLIY